MKTKEKLRKMQIQDRMSFFEKYLKGQITLEEYAKLMNNSKLEDEE